MELLSRQRAVFDNEHSWKWLGEAERWGHLGTERGCIALQKDWSDGDGAEYD